MAEQKRTVRPLPDGPVTAGSWLAELYKSFAPVRQEAIDRGYTEEDINETIDEAIAAVRQQRDEGRR